MGREYRERGEEEKGVRGDDDEESGYMMQDFIAIGGTGRIVTWIAIRVDVIGPQC